MVRRRLAYELIFACERRKQGRKAGRRYGPEEEPCVKRRNLFAAALLHEGCIARNSREYPEANLQNGKPEIWLCQWANSYCSVEASYSMWLFHFSRGKPLNIHLLRRKHTVPERIYVRIELKLPATTAEVSPSNEPLT